MRLLSVTHVQQQPECREASTAGCPSRGAGGSSLEILPAPLGSEHKGTCSGSSTSPEGNPQMQGNGLVQSDGRWKEGLVWIPKPGLSLGPATNQLAGPV